MEKSLAGCILSLVQLSANKRVVNRRGRRGIRAGTQRFFSATSARTSATSAVNLVLAIAAVMLVISPRSLAQEPVPAPGPSPITSAQQPLNVPTVAIDHRANANQPLPMLNRVGVDTNEQQPLTLREAIALALVNNKDIEVARDNVRVAEYDLLTAHGAYDPKLSAQSYFERIKTPASSFLSGATGAVENSDFTATTRFEGLSPKYGGNYRVDFSSVRA